MLHEIIASYRVVFSSGRLPITLIVFLAYFASSASAFASSQLSLLAFRPDAYWTPTWRRLVTALTSYYYRALEAEIIKGALNSFDKGQADAAILAGIYRSPEYRRRIMFCGCRDGDTDLMTSTLVIAKIVFGFAIEVVEYWRRRNPTLR